MKNEPVINVAILTSIIVAIVGFTAAFGLWSPTKTQVTSIVTLVGVLVPFIGALVARSKVTPV